MPRDLKFKTIETKELRPDRKEARAYVNVGNKICKCVGMREFFANIQSAAVAS